MSTDLFGDALPEPPPPPMVHLHAEVTWLRLQQQNKPPCGHCVMLTHYGHKVEILRARWMRTGIDGSVLELCETHKQHQEQRDKHAESLLRDAQRYEKLAGAIVDTMEDRNAWDDGESPQEDLLINYVQFLVAKIYDINLVLDRDMRD